MTSQSAPKETQTKTIPSKRHINRSLHFVSITPFPFIARGIPSTIRVVGINTFKIKVIASYDIIIFFFLRNLDVFEQHLHNLPYELDHVLQV